MSETSDQQAIEILSPGRTIARLDITVLANKLPPTYKEKYEELVRRMLSEFPAIEGYETVHALAVERLAYLYIMQKQADNRDNTDVEWKAYKFHTYGFIKTFEALLKEAKNIGINHAFKAALVRDVVAIIDRHVKSKDEKKRIIAELRLLGER